MTIDPSNPEVIYVGGENWDGQNYVTIIAKSIDQGTSWQTFTASTQDIMIYALAVDPTNSDIVYAGGYLYDLSSYTLVHKILKSIDGGVNWTEKISGLSSSGIVYSLVIDPDSPNTIYAGTTTAVYKSVNGADDWINMGCSGVTSLVIDPYSTNVIYAGTYNGIFRSLDGGGNWSELNDGLTVTYVTALALDPIKTNKIYAATYGSGVFTQETSVGIAEQDKLTPLLKSFILYQNYPNPFNAGTEIKYTIPQTGEALLNIYNMKGEFVRTLFRGIRQPGFYKAEWDGQDDAQNVLATGVYLCRLTINGITRTKKMLLIK